MHIVAVTRWGAALEGEISVLAPWFGMSAYDFRLRAVGVLPVVLCALRDAERAQTLVRDLRARSHGAVTCEMSSVPQSSTHFVPFELELRATSLRAIDSGGRDLEVAYCDVLAMVRAVSIQSAESTVTTSEKKLNVSRAILTGGLMVNKTVERTTRTATEAREHVLYMFRRSTLAPLVFRELSMSYVGIADQLKPSASQNFNLLIEQLRARAPGALYDQRFVTQKRKVGLSAVAGIATDRTVESSNRDENDLGAFLMVLGHSQQQL